jgi:hypothetical protein
VFGVVLKLRLVKEKLVHNIGIYNGKKIANVSNTTWYKRKNVICVKTTTIPIKLEVTQL